MPAKSKYPYIKFNWVSDDPRLSDRADELTAEYLGQYQRKPKKDFQQAFVVILTSLQVLTRFQPEAGVLIPTDINLYSGKTRRNPTYTNEIRRCLTWMMQDAQGYLTKLKGVHQSNSASRTVWLPSAYQIGPNLSEGELASPKSISRNPLLGYVELRVEYKRNGRKAKRAIPIPDDQAVRYGKVIKTTDSVLRKYDAMMKDVDIRLGNNLIYPAMTSMIRIFSRGDMRLGGRFYSPIQNLKSEARKYLSFDSDPVVEIDYSAIHPSILYHQKGVALDSDPYVIDGHPRKEVKLAFNIMINRKGGPSRSSAANTIARELDCQLERAKALEKAILYHHSQINEHFNSDAGLALQRLDSKIALLLLKQFVAEQRPIITIHDSALVSVRDTETLKLAMDSAYCQVVSNKKGRTVTLNAIKVESLDFTQCLSDLVVRSLNGTLEGDDYSKDTWDRSIALNTDTKCANGLTSYQYYEGADDV